MAGPCSFPRNILNESILDCRNESHAGMNQSHRLTNAGGRARQCATDCIPNGLLLYNVLLINAVV
jgi:hypothetical protein